MIGRPRGTTKDTSSLTARERAIVRHYLAGTDFCAKDTGAAFRVSAQYVNRLVREAMGELGCKTRRQLARIMERRANREELPVSLWN